MVSSASRGRNIADHKLETIVIGISLLFAPGTAASEDLRAWIEANAMAHDANDLSRVPDEYRGKGPLYLADAPGPADHSSDQRELHPDAQTHGISQKDRKFESLIKALKVSDTAAVAAAALGEIGDERAVDPLIELLYRNYPKWWRGKHAAREALFKIGGTRALKALISVLDDEDLASYVRSSLVKRNGPHVIDLLTATICNDDENPLIIHEAGKVLSEMGERGVDSLLSCLQNANCSCNKRNQCAGRRTAVYHLGRLKAARAAGPLIEMLNEQFVDIYITNSMHAFVSGALSEITGMTFGKDYRAWKKWQADVRSATQQIINDDQQLTAH